MPAESTGEAAVVVATVAVVGVVDFGFSLQKRRPSLATKDGGAADDLRRLHRKRRMVEERRRNLE